jgi:hypothetical protein
MAIYWFRSKKQYQVYQRYWAIPNKGVCFTTYNANTCTQFGFRGIFYPFPAEKKFEANK